MEGEIGRVQVALRVSGGDRVGAERGGQSLVQRVRAEVTASCAHLPEVCSKVRLSGCSGAVERRRARHNGAVSVFEKPRLRGVFHHWAFFVAVVAGVVLVTFADGAMSRFAAWVYVTALAAMFGASALYHRYPFKSAARRMWARRLDHSTIFLFIAGTYTPFALLAFDGTISWIVLATVWFGAALGLVLNFVWLDAPRWVTALAYMAVGWVGVITIPQMFSGVGVPGRCS